jgi:hypothetical protein
MASLPSLVAILALDLLNGVDPRDSLLVHVLEVVCAVRLQSTQSESHGQSAAFIQQLTTGKERECAKYE